MRRLRASALRREVMQLSPESETVVRATAGVVAEHAEEITRLFYPRMFAAHPELLRVFNRAHQAHGEQPRALAASVVAFAVSLIDPEAPDFTPAMRRIAHKHVSLGIRARQYTIVGHHLLDAVGIVLGDAVTPEVRAAWDEVYWLFGCSLIAEEARLYALAGTDPEHPWRKHRVVERIAETDDVVTLVLEPLDGAVADHRAGQYVAVAVDLPDGSRQPRQYTLSSAPGGGALRVTVKRVRGIDGAPDGQVSTWLHDNAMPGTILDVSQPAGDVVLDESHDPLVLVSAGIGITPVAAMLDGVRRTQPERTVRLFHADRTPSSHALVGPVQENLSGLEDATAVRWYSSAPTDAPVLDGVRAGRMDLTDVELPAGARVLLCGPLGFMRDMRASLLGRGVPAERIDYEVFGPDTWMRHPADASAA
ncbi:globin domain-containing protein [Microbacterium sp. K35]|uniref:globin domain-containing protein n=1 Tax=Microbacterium sp. K35 TaxID=2305440 RepID=UPI0023AB22B6|nr:globin domain-containing protein [Microbacterium sp. K35]